MQCDYRVVSAPRYLAVFRSLSEKVLRGSLCKLRASVVNVFPGNFTTETQSITEFAQRNSFFRQTPKGGTSKSLAKSFTLNCSVCVVTISQQHGR